MIKGKLQPALNYKIEQPTYNRYEIDSDMATSKGRFQEIITYPSVTHGHHDFQLPRRIKTPTPVVEDPRTVEDLYAENMQLKEQMIE